MFIGPGAVPPEAGFTYQRSIEYSPLDGTYGSFLEKDILPIVEADYNISRDPALRTATGGSEGGICAFALGWFRPDLFGKVLSWVGPFVWSRVRFPVRFVGEHFPADEPAQLRRATTACNMPMVGVVPVGRRVQVLWSGSRDG